MKLNKTKTSTSRIKIFSLSLLALLTFVILSLQFASSRDFIINEVSNPSTSYFVVNGTSGFVGIGTSSPTHLLNVLGTFNVTGSSYHGANVSIGNFYINNLANPLQNQDAATKAYVDSVTGGGSSTWNLTSGIVHLTSLINNVSIGSTSSSFKLGVVGDIGITNGSLWQPVYPSDDGLVLYLPFSEGTGTTTYDKSPYGNDGILYNGSTASSCAGGDCPTWSTGKYGKAILFDGSNDYVQSPASIDFVNMTSPYSVSVWFNTLNATMTGGQALALQASSAGGRRFLFYLSGTGIIYLQMSNASSYPSIYATPAVSAGNWYHASATYDNNTGTARIYVDGVLRATGSINITAQAGTAVYNIGGDRIENAGLYFNGTIDEVKVYNRALSADEIRTQYLSGMQSHGYTLADRFKIINTTASRILEVNNTGLTIGTGATISGTSTGLGVGTNAPTALLDVSGTARIRNTLNMSGYRITNLSTPTNADDAATKAYVDALNVSSSAADDWNLSGSNLFPKSLAWNVGIRTSTPSFALQVGTNGTGNSLTTGLSGDVRIPSYSGGIAYLQARESGATNVTLQIRTQKNGGVVNAMYLDENGNVGIGTASPTQLLDVRGNINVSNEVYVKNGTAVSQWMYNQTSASSSLDTWNLSGTNLFPRSLGYSVGIGTSTPSVKLDVTGDIRSNSTYRYSQTEWIARLPTANTDLFAFSLDGGTKDVFLFKNVTTVELFNSTSGTWQTWSQSLNNLFDDDPTTGVTITNDSTGSSVFRFVINSGTWTCPGLFVLEKSYTSTYTNVSVIIDVTGDPTGATDVTNVYNSSVMYATNHGNRLYISRNVCYANSSIRMTINSTHTVSYVMYGISAMTGRLGVSLNPPPYKKDYTSAYISEGVAIGYSTSQSTTPTNGLLVAGNVSVDSGTFFVDTSANKAGIGTTTPTQLLDVRGNINVSNEVYVKNGTAVSQWMYNQTSASSNLDYWNLSGSNLFPRSLGYTTGIGTANPNTLYALDIFGRTRVYANTTAVARFEVASLAYNDSFVVIISNDTTKGFFGFDDNNNVLQLTAGTSFSSNPQLTLLGTGQIGIGTATPSTQLAVSGNFSTTTGAFLATTSGNVGIGTTTPTQLLDVRGNINVSNEVYVKNGTAVSQWMYNQTSASSNLDYWNLSGSNLFPRSLGYNVSIGGTTASVGEKLTVNGSIGIINGSLWQPVYPSDDGLVLYLPFSEGQGTTTYDKSPYGNDGAITGATWTTGKYGNALSLNGLGDYVNIGDLPILRFTNESNFTISSWINKPGQTNGTAGNPIFDKFASQGYRLYEEGGALRFDVRNSTLGISTHLTSYDVISNNTWTYVAVTFSQGRILLYADGIMRLNATAAVALSNGTTSATVGRMPNNPDAWFNGTIDEVKVYSRALSADEIRTQYLSGMQSHGYTLADRFRIINTTASRILEVNNTGLTIGTGPTISGTSTGLGIGTSTPSNKLDVRGDLNVSAKIYFNNASDISVLWNNDTYLTTYNSTYATWAYNQSFVVWNVSGTNIFQNNLAANVGIGTISPAYKLEIVGNLNVTSGLNVTAGGLNVLSGNVGIGTSSPVTYTNYKTLAVSGTTGGAIDLMSGVTVVGQLSNTASLLSLKTNNDAYPVNISGSNVTINAGSTGNVIIVILSGPLLK